MSRLPRNYRELSGDFTESLAGVLEARLEQYCESPIETTFLVTFKLIAGMLGDPVLTVVKGELLGDPKTAGWPWYIEPQFAIDNYRVDFAIGPWPKDGRMLIVECDGHDFHERTKEQAARDRSRAPVGEHERYFHEVVLAYEIEVPKKVQA